MKIGDEVMIKGTKAKGVIIKFLVEGCQLHGEPIKKIALLTTAPGHFIKNNMRLIVDLADVERAERK